MKGKQKTPKKGTRRLAAHHHAERVHAYARAVVAGQIVAGRYVVQACQRHLDDLVQGPARGLIWDPQKAHAHITFFEEVLHLKEDTPFKLEEFQAFILGSIYGWYRRDDDTPPASDLSTLNSQPSTRNLRRRFRYVYAEMGKGSGKTPMAAGIGLDGLVIDDEHAPEIYSAAAAKDQARICFNDANQMVEASPELRGTIVSLTNSLTVPRRHAAFRPLSSEDRGQHGLRPHVVILDEVHAHRSAALARAMIAGTKGRRNALIVLITNSGSDRTGLCWHHHEEARKILDGTIRKDDTFAYVCTLDPCPACLAIGKRQPDPKCKHCDDWRNPATWIKANPRLADPDVRRYVAERVDRAQTMPSELNDVLQLNFCQWTTSDVGWMNMFAWNNTCLRSALKIEDFAGRLASVAMDAANKVDVTSMVAVFEEKPGSGKLDPAALNRSAQAALAAATGMQPDGSSLNSQPSTLNSSATLADAIRELSAAGYVCFARHFVPEDMVNNADAPNHELYREWQAAGKLIVTSGARTSFATIMATLRDWRRLFRISRFSFDPREMSYFVEQLQAQEWCDFPLVEVTQSPAMISQPMKELEALACAGLIHHDGDPVLTWMVGNVIQKSTITGNQTKAYFPARPSEHEKIDGAAALIMAIDGILRSPPEVGEAWVGFV